MGMGMDRTRNLVSIFYTLQFSTHRSGINTSAEGIVWMCGCSLVGTFGICYSTKTNERRSSRLEYVLR